MTTSQEMFDSLVKNAIDFLSQSIANLTTSPKYSVINFYASIELFLKARLMLEHWALIYDEPKDADRSKFLAGDFRSVNMEEATRRLEKTTKVQISKKTLDSFKELQEHRNKLMHFFHPQYNTPDGDVIQGIVSEQCKAWLHLHNLLTNQWKDKFIAYVADLENLNKQMLEQRAFLQAKYESIAHDIEKGKERGIIFLYCYSCRYQASRIVNDDERIIETKCLVCGNSDSQLMAPCPNCKNSVYVYDLGEGTCETCETSIDINYLIKIFGTHDEGRYTESSHAYCSQCEYTELPTVVETDDNEWACLFCFAKYDHIEQCEWCSESIAGDLSDSYWSGCVMCEGKRDWDKD